MERRRRLLGNDDQETLSSILNLGVTYRSQGKYAEAEPLFAEIYERAQRAPISPIAAAECAAHYGPCLVKLSRYAEAEQPTLEAEHRLRETGQLNGENARMVCAALVELYDQTNRPDEAARWRARLGELKAAAPEPQQPATAPAR